MNRVVRDDTEEMLEKLIYSKGLKKSFVAHEVGISAQNLRNRLRNKTVDADLAFKLAKALGVNSSIFLSKSYRDNLK